MKVQLHFGGLLRNITAALPIYKRRYLIIPISDFFLFAIRSLWNTINLNKNIELIVTPGSVF